MATKTNDKIGYSSACMKDISKILASNRGFSGSGYWTVKILPQPTLVALATKFGSKLAITRIVYDISPRSLRRAKVFGAELLNHASQILPRPTLVDMATKFEEFGRKLAITW